MTTSTRWLIGIGAALVLVAGASVVVALVAGGEQEFAEGTPEHAVQQYLKAVADRDADAAISWLSSGLLSRCGEIPRDAITYRDWRFRASLEETIERGDRVEVRVRIGERYGTLPFDRGESMWSLSVELLQEEGTWRFAEAPWPLYCPPPSSPPAPVR